MTFHQYISKGISGKNQGLKNGFNKLNKYLYNLLPSTYYLIGGGSGAAKTSLVNYILFNAIEDAKVQDKELIILYYAFEIGEMPMKAAFLSNSAFCITAIFILVKFSALDIFDKAKLNKVASRIGNNKVQNIICLSRTIHFNLYL